MTKCIVIGLDGASPVLFKWAKEGKLPNIARIIENGVSSELQSTIPFFTGVAWPSFLTGKNPGKTGFFGWRKRIPGTYNTRMFNSEDLDKAVPLWRILNSYSKESIFLGIPFTYPPKKIKGVMVSGFPAPHLSAYPTEVLTKLKEIGFETDVRGEENIESFYDLSKRQTETLFYLMDKYEWDFFIVNYQAHQHWLIHGMVLPQCQDLDNKIGDILKRLDKDTMVILMSDHGTMPVYKDIFINEFLKKLGLLEIIERLSALKYLLIILNIVESNFSKIFRKLNLNLPFIRLILSTIMMKLSSWLSSKFLDSSKIDWSRSKAFSIEADSIFINLEGREPKGVVNSCEYDDLRNHIIEELSKLKDPITGVKVIDNVYKKEEIYHGEYMNYAPDLLVTPNEGYRLALFNFDGSIIETTLRKTYQEKPGIFAAMGPNIKKGVYLGEEIQLVDLAPTILHMLNLPIVKDMDGKVLIDIFEEGSEYAERTPKYLDIGEKKIIKKKIKDLKTIGEI